MDIPVLKVEPRQDRGKGPAKQMRERGMIPAVCYGRAKEPLAISLDPGALQTILRSPLGRNSLIKLDGAEDRTVFVQFLQRDPVERDIIHVDFIFVDTKKPVRRNVPLEYPGKPEGVKAGGVLQITRREIPVDALPDRIPEKLVINVEPLLIGQSIHVEEIELPEGVTAIYDHNYTLCGVVAPSEDKVEEPELTPEEIEAAEAAAAAEGEVPAEGKPGEEKPAGEEKKEVKPADDKK